MTALRFGVGSGQAVFNRGDLPLPNGLVAREVRSGGSAHGRVSLEVAIPRGGVLQYGLAGVDLSSRAFGADCVLAAEDGDYEGLLGVSARFECRLEFVWPLVEEIGRTLDSEPNPGRVLQLGYCPVGSSPWLFSRIGRALCMVSELESPTPTDVSRVVAGAFSY